MLARTRPSTVPGLGRRIGAGTKIDNQVQIGHNVRIGKCCLLVAQVGVSGSAELGRRHVWAGRYCGTHPGGGRHVVAGAAVMPGGREQQGHWHARGTVHPDELDLQFVKKVADLFKRFDRLEKTVECLATSSEGN